MMSFGDGCCELSRCSAARTPENSWSLAGDTQAKREVRSTSFIDNNMGIDAGCRLEQSRKQRRSATCANNGVGHTTAHPLVDERCEKGCLRVAQNS